MVRSLLTAAVLACMLPSLSEATPPAKPKPSFGNRVKSLFGFKTEAPPAPKPVIKPQQITTRSGSLRQPGPEVFPNKPPKPTPTFAQPKQVLKPSSAPPRRLSPQAAKPLSAATGRTPRMRDSQIQPAAFERPAPPQPAVRKPKASWWNRLWNREEPQPAPLPPSMKRPLPKDPSLGTSTSIDPRRVYRGASQPDSDAPATSRRPRSNFSETGVPQSTSEFRGRRDTAF